MSRGDASLTTVGWPLRLSPDGAWLLVPTPEDGTWLFSADGETWRQLTPERLTATWATDSHRVVFRGEIGPQPRERDGEIYVWDVIDEEEAHPAVFSVPERKTRPPGSHRSSRWNSTR
jgi:hypothetical protein